MNHNLAGFEDALAEMRDLFRQLHSGTSDPVDAAAVNAYETALALLRVYTHGEFGQSLKRQRAVKAVA